MQSPGMSFFLRVARIIALLLCAISLLLILFLFTRLTAQSPSSQSPIFHLQSSIFDFQSSTPQSPITITHYLPLIAGPPPARLIIAAAHIDSRVSYEPDEALLLWNIGYSPQPLAGWRLTAGTRHATFSLTSTLTLDGGARIWCAAQADAFRLSFGEEPACVWADAGDNQGARPVRLDGTLQFSNRGGMLQLANDAGEIVDTLLYGDEAAEAVGWQGAPMQPYDRGAIPQAGQVLTRKQDPRTFLPVDTDRASDWSSDLADVAWGRRVRYPGWRGWTAETGGLPQAGATAASITVAIGPEGLYATVADALIRAQSRLDLSIYTLEHPELTEALVAAAGRGVVVRVLLEGSPPGGISDLQKWCATRLAAAGADVRYLAPRADAPTGLRPRFSYTHAKYVIIDGEFALVGTDNFNRDSMPVDSAAGGRRGVYLLTDALPAVNALQAIFDGDWQPELFADLHPFAAEDERYGAPPADFVLPDPPEYITVDQAFRMPVTGSGPAQFMLVSAPENALRPDAGVMALIAQAGPGDEILLEQLYEHKFWGDGESNPIADPNPRLEAAIDAARRGATVRLLLDSFFDDADHPRSNRATVEYVRAVAAAEGLDLDARAANPTGGGIHAKLVLVRVGDARWSAVGSLNGSEISHKLNREIILLTDMPAVHLRLEELFWHDWESED
ncbi:MAG: hypothetical protein KDD92_20825 [Caldilineaceae bacterium]|nr:hypothetical protein [Caldilineaceae bacterium]